ncbi:hypothetical protein T492DRAFT_525782 [Pavlovales sp. CCMP2436]|nr:hypothetical protein T492DRAFT_525782 [Pavlovales sp. CCMP2436]
MERRGGVVHHLGADQRSVHGARRRSTLGADRRSAQICARRSAQIGARRRSALDTWRSAQVRGADRRLALGADRRSALGADRRRSAQIVARRSAARLAGAWGSAQRLGAQRRTHSTDRTARRSVLGAAFPAQWPPGSVLGAEPTARYEGAVVTASKKNERGGVVRGRRPRART